MRHIILVTALIGCTVMRAAQAQAPTPAPLQPVDVVAVRQAGMALSHGTYRGLAAAVEAKAEPARYVQAARGLAAWGRQIPALFPAAAGTGRLGFPTIFTERAEFEAAAAAFVTAAEALHKVTLANDAAAFPAAVKAVTDACLGCHPRKFADNWLK